RRAADHRCHRPGQHEDRGVETARPDVHQDRAGHGRGSPWRLPARRRRPPRGAGLGVSRSLALIDESALAVRAGAEAAARSRLRSRRVIIGMILFAMVLPLVAFEVILAAFPRERLPGALRTINTFYARRAEWNTLIAGDAYLGFKLRPDVEVRWPFEAGTVAVRTTSHGLGPLGFRDIGTRPPFHVI